MVFIFFRPSSCGAASSQSAMAESGAAGAAGGGGVEGDGGQQQQQVRRRLPVSVLVCVAAAAPALRPAFRTPACTAAWYRAAFTHLRSRRAACAGARAPARCGPVPRNPCRLLHVSLTPRSCAAGGRCGRGRLHTRRRWRLWGAMCACALPATRARAAYTHRTPAPACMCARAAAPQ